MFGEVKKELGHILNKDRFQLVKKAGIKGDKIPKHNHPKEDILFTVVKGCVRVFLNDTEVYELKPGEVLYFDGIHYIHAEFIEDGEVFVTLIQK